METGGACAAAARCGPAAGAAELPVPGPVPPEVLAEAFRAAVETRHGRLIRPRAARSVQTSVPLAAAAPRAAVCPPFQRLTVRSVATAEPGRPRARLRAVADRAEAARCAAAQAMRRKAPKARWW
ncbi:hypothetical protein GCM10027440_04020 [Nocardiopsis coralliicola]